uniref:PX n=1 Tax=short-tailed pygmy chameleon adenovirus 1 TaxID=1631551 RepID=A0A0H3VBK6_9ADEN|nr:pX [short-tailed pygmy chameleon adenovirus 1]
MVTVRVVRRPYRRRQRRRTKRVTRTETVVRARSSNGRRRVVYQTSKMTKVGNRRMRGGFLPLLPLLGPIIASAIGAVPGIVMAAKSR